MAIIQSLIASRKASWPLRSLRKRTAVVSGGTGGKLRAGRLLWSSGFHGLVCRVVSQGVQPFVSRAELGGRVRSLFRLDQAVVQASPSRNYCAGRFADPSEFLGRLRQKLVRRRSRQLEVAWSTTTRRWPPRCALSAVAVVSHFRRSFGTSGTGVRWTFQLRRACCIHIWLSGST